MASQQIILKCFKTINFRWRRERIFNKTLALAVESEIYNYAKSNLAIINIFIKEPYSKRFRKTEKMSRIAYIASSGGLLGRVQRRFFENFMHFLDMIDSYGALRDLLPSPSIINSLTIPSPLK